MAARSASKVRLLAGLVASAAALCTTGSASAQVLRNVSTVEQLYAVIDEVNANPGAFFDIQLAAGTYALTRELRVTAGAAMITGALQNPDSRRLSGQNSVRVLNVSAGANGAFVYLRGLTVENGRSSQDVGGGIRASRASLYVENSIIRNNVALGFGAGIYAQSTPGIVYIERSLIQNNAGSSVATGDCGGGFFTNGGGVVFSQVAEAYIFNSSIIDNQHCRWGGVASLNSSTVLIQNTIARNRGVENGGGVVARGPGALTMAFNTVSENVANLNAPGAVQPRVGAGLFLYEFSGTLAMNGNIFARNQNFNGLNSPRPEQISFEDFWAHPSQPPFGGFSQTNWLNNFQHWTFPHSADSMGIGDGYVGTDPQLGPLRDNGATGNTFVMPTYLVAPTSALFRGYFPLEDQPWTMPWSFDQRNFARPGPSVTLGSTEP